MGEIYLRKWINKKNGQIVLYPHKKNLPKKLISDIHKIHKIKVKILGWKMMEDKI